MQLAGLEGQQVVLLLEDYQFVHPAFLEMVNSLLSSGMNCVFSLTSFFFMKIDLTLWSLWVYNLFLGLMFYLGLV